MDRFKEKATEFAQFSDKSEFGMVSCAGHCRTLLLGAIFRFSLAPNNDRNLFEMIEVNNLTCEYAPGTPALSVHELNIRSGELTFVGRFGSGKSTLLEALGLMTETARSTLNIPKLKPTEESAAELCDYWSGCDQTSYHEVPVLQFHFPAREHVQKCQRIGKTCC